MGRTHYWIGALGAIALGCGDDGESQSTATDTSGTSGDATGTGDPPPPTTSSSGSETPTSSDTSSSGDPGDTSTTTGEATPTTTEAETTTTSTTTGGSSSSTGTLFDGPVLIDAEAISDTEIRLSFSDALADVAGVDPEQFRISSGGYYTDTAQTWYQDPGYYAMSNIYAVSIANDSDYDYALLVTLSGSLDEICSYMATWEEVPTYADVLLYPHFDPEIPTITDENDNPAQPFAPGWVQADPTNYTVVGGHFPEMDDPPLGFPCPPAGVPG